MSLEARPLNGAPLFKDISCPYCGKSRRASAGRYVCGGCGNWFEVAEEGGQA